MASYEDDHNIRTPTPSTNANARPVHTSLSEHLTGFFSLERDPGRAAEQGDFRSLATALEEFSDSPLARQMAEHLQQEAESVHGSAEQGMPQHYLDALDRVNKKTLRADDSCPICAGRYLDDPYPLVVNLPCNSKHRFDLECIGPWLKLHSTCPLCRTDLAKKKEPIALDDSEEEYDDTYG